MDIGEAIQLVVDHWQPILVAVGAVTLSASALVKALEAVARGLELAAVKLTPDWDTDERVLGSVARALAKASDALEWVSRIIRPVSLRGKQ